MSKRNPKTLGVWGQEGTRVIAAESYWRQPIAWNAAADKIGERHRVFCASLADVFEGPSTMPPEAHASIVSARDRLFELIIDTPALDWLLLTKRPENIESAIADACWPATGCGMFGVDDLPRNLWLGTSVENRPALSRIDTLRNIPAKVRFLSVEPLLEDLGKIDLRGIHWVIVGGESGPKSRPFYVNWADSIRDQCRAAGVACFIKQMGGNVHCVDDEFGDMRIELKHHKGADPEEWPADLRVFQYPV